MARFVRVMAVVLTACLLTTVPALAESESLVWDDFPFIDRPVGDGVAPAPGASGAAPQQVPGRAGAAPQQIPNLGTAIVPAGWISHEAPAEGYAIALPPGWQAFGRAELTELGVPAAPRGDIGLLLVAADQDGGGAAVLLAADLFEQMSLDQVIALLLPSLEEAGEIESPIARRRVGLAAGPAEELRFTMRVANTPTADRVEMSVYVTLKDQRVYFLILAAESSRAGELRSTLDQIAYSFRPL